MPHNRPDLHRESLATLLMLPVELISLIVEDVDREDLKQLRQCSKWFAKLTTHYLFDSINILLISEGMERAVQIANSQLLAEAVTKLRLYQGPRRMSFESEFDEFSIQIARQCGAQYKNDLDFMESLHSEYEAERVDCSLYHNVIQAPRPRLCGQKSHPTGTKSTRTATKTRQICLDFEDALLKFSNLKSIEVDSRDGCQAFEWRGYTIRPSEVHRAESEENAPVEHATSLALVIRTLGWRSFFNKSLTSLKLDFTRTTWSGPKDFEQLWRQNECMNSAGEDFSEGHIDNHNALMGDAFATLTDLSINVHTKCESLLDEAKVLSHWLRKATKLEHLELYLFCHDDHTDRVCGDALALMANTAPWPTLERLQLGTMLSESSLLSLLSEIAPTLASLRLCECELADREESWARFYRKMRDIPFEELRSLELEDLFDRNQDLPPKFSPKEDYPERGIHTSRMEDRSEIVKMYKGDIYSYILKKTDVMLQLHHQPAVSESVLDLEPEEPVDGVEGEFIDLFSPWVDQSL